MIRPGARPRWQGWRGLCAAAILLCAARAAAGELAAGAPVADRAAADRLRQSVRADYVLQCAGCHRVDGRGSSRHGIPDFRNSVGAFVHLPEGREYLVRVPGAAQSQLSNAELAAVLNWVLEEFSPAQLPGDFRPYTEQEVARSGHAATRTWCRCATGWRRRCRGWASRWPTIPMAATENPSGTGT